MSVPWPLFALWERNRNEARRRHYVASLAKTPLFALWERNRNEARRRHYVASLAKTPTTDAARTSAPSTDPTSRETKTSSPEGPGAAWRVSNDAASASDGRDGDVAAFYVPAAAGEA